MTGNEKMPIEKYDKSRLSKNIYAIIQVIETPDYRG
jgi:hypothetical protein